MTWQVRHEGSPKAVGGLSVNQIVQGLRDGIWSTTDEVRGPQDASWAAIENHPQFAEVAEEVDQPPRRKEDDETRIDMNALIDVTLVLLIFFILTTTHAVAVQKIVPLKSITDAQKGTKVYHHDQVKKYMIHLKVTGSKGQPMRVQLENAPIKVVKNNRIDKVGLSKLIRPHVTGQPPKTEMLLDAQNASWGTVIAIQDAAKSAGVRIIHHLHRQNN